MKTCDFQLSVPLFAAIALAGAGVAPLQAQESIIFSRPTENVTTKANSFMEQQTRKAPADYVAPSSIFNSTPEASFDVLPGASRPKPLSAEELRQMQKNYDQSKNWTLMTPAEIMGVPTPEKILGMADPDKNLTTTERYFKRQDQQRSASATNAMMRSQSGNNLDENNPFANSRDDLKNKKRDSIWNTPDQTSATDKYRRTAQEIEQAERRASSPWSSAFNIPVAPKKSDYEIQAALDRSRASAGMPTAPVAAGFSAVPSRTTASFGKPETKPSPVANSYTPIRDTASKPVSVAPLPTLASAREQALKNTPKPKSLVQPPPWVVSEDKSENPYAAPKTFQKRKF